MVGSDIDKNNKHHKYTLDETVQPVLEFDDESDYSDLLGPSLKYQCNDCNQLLFLTLFSRNSFTIHDVSNSCLLFRPY